MLLQRRRTPLSLLNLINHRTLCTATTTNESFSIKNVTRSNFNNGTTLESLTQHIKAADFVAIDLEMTGVTTSPWRDSFDFDRHDIRYLKLRDSAVNFAVLQFGVCPFSWDPLSLSFRAHPHNFYIFPRQELPADGPSCEFLCQTSSIDFLAKYKFDFNACIREGVSYLSRRQEEDALRRLNTVYDENWHDSEDFREVKLTNFSDVLFSERIRNRLNEWHESLLHNGSTESQSSETAGESKQQFETIFFNMRPALRLTGFTSHQLRLIELVTSKHFKELVYVRAYDEGSVLQKLIVHTDSENDKKILMKEVKDGLYEQGRGRIKEAVGFRHVIDLLSSEKKLIVGHNCFLDMAHMYHKFIGPLPSTVEDFASNIHSCFPCIIDTKILLNADKRLQLLMNKSSTSLASAFTHLCPEIAARKSPGLGMQQCVKVEVHVDDMRSSNWNSGAKHEAGYDAFMTGCVFAQACSHLGFTFPSGDITHNEALQKYVNHLYLSWNSGDMINVSTGDTSELSTGNSVKKRFHKILHDNVVLIWGFPSKLKAAEIRECICKVFGASSVTSIYHLDESVVFVQFSKPELVADFLMLKETLETCNNSISVLHPLSKLLEGGKTCAAGYEVYKDICGSSISKLLFAQQAEVMGINQTTKITKVMGEVEDPAQEACDGTVTSYPVQTEKLSQSVG